MPATRTSRTAWVEEGLRALAAGGPDGVRVEPLARTLGVTKGSFYWHFADRGALLEAVVDEWERASADAVMEEVDRGGGDARDRLERLFALGRAGGAILRVDHAIRDWARRDAAIAERLRRVDNRRMAYMRSLFAELFPDHDEVEERCTLIFALWVGSPFMAVDHGERSRADVVEAALRRLLD